MSDLQETVAIAIGSLPLNEDGEYLLDYWGDDMVDRAADAAIAAARPIIRAELFDELIAWAKERAADRLITIEASEESAFFADILAARKEADRD